MIKGMSWVEGFMRYCVYEPDSDYYKDPCACSHPDQIYNNDNYLFVDPENDPNDDFSESYIIRLGDLFL